MDKDYLVTKSNYFIMNSSYDLSLEEQKIILTLASMVQPTDEEFKPYRFKISDFIDLLGIENQAKYSEIPKVTKELMKKVFEIQEGDTLTQIAWLSSATYKKGTGIVELEFSPKLKPYMLQLGTLFTQYKLANILNMKSKYSPRIYEFLKCNQYKKQGCMEIEVEELRRLLKADNIYPLYNDFKRFVIERTQKELKKLSDISFEIEEIKTGRKVTSIRFIIKSNIKPIDEVSSTKDIKTPLEENNGSKALISEIKGVFQEDITENEAGKVLKVCKGNIDLVIEKYKIAQQTNGIKNIVGFVIKAIKEDYKMPKGKGQPSAFNNYKQVSYDFDQIEKNLVLKNEKGPLIITAEDWNVDDDDELRRKLAEGK